MLHDLQYMSSPRPLRSFPQTQQPPTFLHRDCKLPHGEIAVLCLLLLSLRMHLLLLQSTPDLTRLLRPQIQRHILLALLPAPGLPSLGLLLLVVDRQDPRDGLPHDLDLRQLRGRPAGHLRDAELRELVLHLVQLLEQLLGGLRAELVGLDAHHADKDATRCTCKELLKELDEMKRCPKACANCAS